MNNAAIFKPIKFRNLIRMFGKRRKRRGTRFAPIRGIIRSILSGGAANCTSNRGIGLIW